MRITLTAIGSRGDVQPYLALGAGLRRAGHAVRLATHDEFQGLVDEQGLEFFPMSGSPREMIATDAGRAMLEAGSDPLQFLVHFARLLRPYFARFLGEQLEACAGAEALLFSGTSFFTGTHLAEKLGVPMAAGLLQPLVPSAQVGSPFCPPCPRWWPWPGAYHLLSHAAMLGLVGLLFGSVTHTIRRMLDLPPTTKRAEIARLRDPRLTLLFGISPTVIPPPGDWPGHCHLTGYWFLEQPAWTPPVDLEAFLADGPPPVYLGFGSIRSQDPAAATRLVVRALELSGQRGVLYGGWDGFDLDALPGSVFPLGATSHAWLFPRMAAVMHHGGAGTTAATLRAGVPGIVVPFFADQPFWAHRVTCLGVGPTPIPHARLTPERLAAAIRQSVEDADLRARAAALGARIRAEDGVGTAVAAFERGVRSGEMCRR
jgi:UDP:flavonoid glycosyltransferase YjiC (YdhE family)